MANIKIMEQLIEIKDADLASLEEHFGSEIKIKSKLIEIFKPDLPSRNVSAGDFYVCKFDSNDTIGMKRCFNRDDYIQRELFVATLRRLFKMNHYQVSYKQGFRLRDKISCQIIPIFTKWENSQLVFIEFGKLDTRKNLEQLSKSDIYDLNDFYFQYGECCAFDYIIGAQDRAQRNYVYDLQAHNVYSIDNEDRPIQPNQEFKNPDSEVGAFAQVVQKFVPTDTRELNRCRNSFTKGFAEKWLEISKLSESLDPATDPKNKRDIDYILAMVTDHDSRSVLSKINL